MEPINIKLSTGSYNFDCSIHFQRSKIILFEDTLLF